MKLASTIAAAVLSSHTLVKNAKKILTTPVVELFWNSELEIDNEIELYQTMEVTDGVMSDEQFMSLEPPNTYFH